jgi:hypothetical protein
MSEFPSLYANAIPATYTDGAHSYTCVQFVGDNPISAMSKVTPGRGPYRGQPCWEIFTHGRGRFVIVDIGYWVISGPNNQYDVLPDFEFRSRFRRVTL